MGYLRTEVKGTIDSLRGEMKLRDEKMELLIRLGDEEMSKRSEILPKGLTVPSTSANASRRWKPAHPAISPAAILIAYKVL